MTDAQAAKPRLEKEGSVAVLYLGEGENRLRPSSVSTLLSLLDDVEAGPYTALVTTAEGKIWSNGFDTAWAAANPADCAGMIEAGERLFARVLTFPIPTVAALGGHAFAGGMILALAHDVRVMREDRGFLCLPEVTFGSVFTRGMTDLLSARMAPQVAHRAMVLGERFPAPVALSLGLIDEAAPADTVVARALSLADELGGHDRQGVAALKEGIYREALSTLGQPPPPRLVQAAIARGRQ